LRDMEIFVTKRGVCVERVYTGFDSVEGNT